MVTYGLNDRSRMSREVHVRFSEGPRVKFPRSAHPRKSGCFSALRRGEFASVMSLIRSFYLRKFCSPLFGFFQVVRGFVQFNEILQRLLRVVMSVP